MRENSECKEVVSTSILLCPNFQIEIKVKSAQNTVLDQVPFSR